MGDFIRACRLLTGEFVIGKIKEDPLDKGFFAEENWIFQDALLWQVFGKDKEGELKLGFLALVPLAKLGNTVMLQTRDIMFWISDLNEELVEKYNDVLSSMSTTPSKKIVTPQEAAASGLKLVK